MSSHHTTPPASENAGGAANSRELPPSAAVAATAAASSAAAAAEVGKRHGHAKKASEVSVVSSRTVYSDSDSDDEVSSATSYMNAAAAVAAASGRPQQHQQQYQQLQHQQLQHQQQQHQQQHGSGGKQKKRKSPSAGWDILTSAVAAAPDPAQPAPRCPAKCEGYLFKRRRFPLKGWHKRWYVCDKGFFYYAKSASEMKSLGRYHGNIDLGNSFISYKRSRRRIHIDAGSIVHHVRCKRHEDFEMWIGQLNRHRTYRHVQLQTQPPMAPVVGVPSMQQLLPASVAAAAAASHGAHGVDVTDTPATTVPLSPAESVKLKSLTIARTGSLTRGGVPAMPHGQVPSASLTATLQRLREPGAADDAVSAKLQRLRGLVVDIEAMLESCSKFTDNGKQPGKASSGGSSGNGSGVSVSVSGGASGGVGGGLQQSSSNPNLQELSTAPNPSKVKQRHSALDVPVGGVGGGGGGSVSGFEAKDLSDTLAVFLMKATTAAELIRAAGAELAGERQRLLAVQQSRGPGGGPAVAVVTAEEAAQLSAQVTELGRQNQELRQRLSVIHGHSDLSAVIVSAVPQALLQDTTNISSSLSRDSMTEYHDAAERLSLDMSSSESEDELSDEDEDAHPPATGDASASASGGGSGGGGGGGGSGSGGGGGGGSSAVVATTGRREVLPVPQPDGGNLSLFNILCRNIGKDLTSVRMPIASNEPLNALQRLCEELEYSCLLDQAAAAKDPLERLVLVAAFAVSAYACTASRSAKKPFNPLLGETYECVREDRGWRFVAEQVSHHPPVAACHCDSDRWELWQDCRLRNKFWGKSLEAQPLGAVRLRLKASGELFQWNKVTTCIYNLFSSSRYIDHYGDLTVQGPAGSQAKLTFHKGGSVSGMCVAPTGETAVFGRWCESLLAGREHTARCVWRSGALPPHSASYYGFTRFAIELNELQDCLVSVLPVTDTRFRPDQRLLEVGDLDSAENQKLRLEAKQRSRQTPVQPRWFRQVQSDKSWEFAREYWCAREAKFAGVDLPDLFD